MEEGLATSFVFKQKEDREHWNWKCLKRAYAGFSGRRICFSVLRKKCKSHQIPASLQPNPFLEQIQPSSCWTLSPLNPPPPSIAPLPKLLFWLSASHVSPYTPGPLWPCVTPSSTPSLSPGLAHSSQSFVLLRLGPPCHCVREASEGWWDRRQRKKRIQSITHDAFYFDTLSFDWLELRALSFVFLMYCLLWNTQLDIQKEWFDLAVI